MVYKRIFLWVEGSDDERFIYAVVKPILEKKYNDVKIVPYAQESKKKINNFLKSIRSMRSDYIFFTDNDSPCVTASKQKSMNKYCQLEEERIQVVVKEIESWYLAGLDEESSKRLGLQFFRITDKINKEKFNNYIPKTFDSRIDFMLEVIKLFIVKVAMDKNGSFRYFINRNHIVV